MDDIEKLRKRFHDVYELRSRLVHGSRSPQAEGLGSSLREAEELARAVLFGDLKMLQEPGLESRDATIKRLDETFVRLADWATRTGAGWVPADRAVSSPAPTP
jgi:hypothetical protein